MAADPARLVVISVQKDGKLYYIHDPSTKMQHGPGIPLDGKHYGWKLQEYFDAGFEEIKFIEKSAAAANADGQKSDMNTLASQRVDIVKLDVGYWGAYTRAREAGSDDRGPQRDFGVVDGSDVYICSYRSTGGHENTGDAPQGSLFRQFLDGMDAARGYVRIRSTAKVPGKAIAGLWFIFPDLHLTERFPDRPPDNIRFAHADAKLQKASRLKMQEYLQRSQILPGPRAMNPTYTQSDNDKVREYLKKVCAGGFNLDSTSPADMWTMNVFSSPIMVPKVIEVDVPFVGKVKKTIMVPTGPQFTVSFTARQVLAEKSIIDREVALDAAWFYWPGPGGGREPDCPHKPTTGSGDGDPRPAVDLINFLLAIKSFAQGKNVVVAQVGDLYELWMNRAFLYTDFKPFEENKASSQKLWIAEAASASGDNTQLRIPHQTNPKMNPAPTTPAGQAFSADSPPESYVFEQWKPPGILRRHAVTADGGSSSSAAARADDLWRRVQSVKTFALPIPSYGTKAAGDMGGAFKTSNHRGQEEFFWNAAILKLLDDLKCRYIHGNHDGYRSDSALTTKLSGGEKAQMWISEDGIWIEHGHRWDEYNRDGLAFGAGVTNLVHYYRPAMLRGDSLMGAVMADEQTKYQSGAGQWYILTTFCKKKFAGVKPWTLFVNGHTHTPDLVRIQFDLTLWNKMQKKAQEVGERASELASEATEGLPDLAPAF